MCKKGSNACKEIVANTKILRYRGKRRDPSVTALINYGLAGPKKDRFYQIFPSARHIPTINKYVGHSKYYVVKKAEKAGVLVPETRLSLSAKEKPSLWLEKRVHSIGGKGIRRARGRMRIRGKYYQRNVKNRVYELRVHAFSWMDRWAVYKRLGEKDTIAWNFSNGGHFQTVHNPSSSKVYREAQEIARAVLELLNMSFGAIDFIVDNHNRVYFIEINSAPGFSGLSDHIYFEAFTQLAKGSKKDVLKYAN